MGIPVTELNPHGAHLELLPAGAGGRAELEAFVHDTYARAYGADVREFMPLLIALRSAAGEPLAVMGVRSAAQQTLFLEQYLDAPVEQVIHSRGGCAVRRERVVELGNLAVAHAGAARWMIVALNAFLRGAGVEWVALTAVPALRNAFAHVGIDLTELAQADGARLGAARARWGSYYDSKPVVLAGDVAQGFERLQQAMQLEQACALLRGLWEQSLADGRLAGAWR
ncbi:MAG: thermostable hemolysin [Pseudomonadota bacterium]